MKRLLCINNGYPTNRNPQFTSYIKTIANCIEKSGVSVDLFVIEYNNKISLLNKSIKYIQFWFKAAYINLNISGTSGRLLMSYPTPFFKRLRFVNPPPVM